MSTQVSKHPEPETESAGDRRRRAKADRRVREETAPDLSDEETRVIRVFRYDPEVPEKEEPRFDNFHVPFEKGTVVLDALIYARDTYDSSLTFRHSCRQAVCGSDALFVNGSQRLGCQTQLGDLNEPVQIKPLPH